MLQWKVLTTNHKQSISDHQDCLRQRMPIAVESISFPLALPMTVATNTTTTSTTTTSITDYDIGYNYDYDYEYGTLMQQEQSIDYSDDNNPMTTLQPAMRRLLLGIPPQHILSLNAVAILWGTQHPIIKMVIDDCDPSAFSLLRFGLGAILATPLWIASRETSSTSTSTVVLISKSNQTLRWGIEMGLWMFLGYACQAIGLETTTALRSGFLLYLNVKFVPFFAFILLGRHISLPTWISALLALTGTALLAYDGSGIALNTGDQWSIAAAAASAMYILRLETASKEVPNAAALNATCLWVVTAAALIWALATSETISTLSTNLWWTITRHPWELIYLSFVTTALANYLQTKAQKHVSAERASVIYAMDPVYGAFFSNLLLGETLTGLGILGAGIITVAAATNAFLDLGSNQLDDIVNVNVDDNVNVVVPGNGQHPL